MHPSRTSVILALTLWLLAASTAHARLGETRAELVQRFGEPGMQSKHSIIAQGKMRDLGHVLHFRQEDWSIQCILIDGRCLKISYSKRGDWTDDQIRLVLNNNTQGARWTETSKPSVVKLRRTWKRADGSTADWTKGGGMTLVWDAFNKAKAKLEEQARVESTRKPNI